MELCVGSLNAEPIDGNEDGAEPNDERRGSQPEYGGEAARSSARRGDHEADRHRGSIEQNEGELKGRGDAAGVDGVGVGPVGFEGEK